MTDEDRLLEAIIAAPDDDAPRLVYADWLQGRGDPRGELILLQCQLAAAPDDERRRHIRIVENKLLADHGDRWTAPVLAVLPTPVPGMKYELEFVRGFVELAKISLACLPRLEVLLERAPLLRRLRIVPGGILGMQMVQQPRLTGLLDVPGLARLTSLELTLPGGGNVLADDIASSPALCNLRTLTIKGSVWGEAAGYYDAKREDLALDDLGAAALAGSRHLAGLRELYLDDNRLTTAGVATIAAGAWRLRSLGFGNNLLGEDASSSRAAKRKRLTLTAALSGPALHELEQLRLTSIPLSPEDAGTLASSHSLSQLHDLDLESCHLGAPGTTALCAQLTLPLRRLRIERNSLGDAGALAVAGCTALATLTSLEAGHNRIGRKGAVALASSPHLARLERLTLNEPRWKPETAKLFADSPTLARTRIYLKGRLLARSKPKSKAKPEPAPALSPSSTAAAKPRKKRTTR